MIGSMQQAVTDPVELFTEWYDQARQHPGIAEAHAMNLATAGADGRPASRMVLMKDYGRSGFVFYTNLGSRKGTQLAENPYAALCFFWEPLGRQVRVEGRVSPVSEAEADAYFASRDIKSRIGAWASQQSRPLRSRTELLEAVAKETLRFATGKVTRPPFWSGFRLTPDRMEFWQRGEYRLHDRRCFTRESGEIWRESLLYP